MGGLVLARSPVILDATLYFSHALTYSSLLISMVLISYISYVRILPHFQGQSADAAFHRY